MGVGVLDHSVHTAQEIAIRAGRLRRVERVQDRFVVLVDQHRDGPTVLSVERFEHRREPLRPRAVLRRNTRPPLHSIELRHQIRVQRARFQETAAREAQPQHGVAYRPVPLVVNGQPAEQSLVSLEQFAERVQKEALSEAPRAGKEVVGSFINEATQKRGLVDIVVPPFPDLSESLNTDGQLASGW